MTWRPQYGICICHQERRLIVVKAGFCAEGNYAQKQAKKGDKAKKSYLSRLSDKRAKEERLYSVARKLFLIHHPACGMNVPNICTGKATEIQHLRGRIGKLFLDQKFWMSACRDCHVYATNNPAEAIEKGWALPRLIETP